MIVLDIICPECTGKWKVEFTWYKKIGTDLCKSCRVWITHREELEKLGTLKRIERLERLLFERKHQVSIPTTFGALHIKITEHSRLPKDRNPIERN